MLRRPDPPNVEIDLNPTISGINSASGHPFLLALKRAKIIGHPEDLDACLSEIFTVLESHSVRVEGISPEQEAAWRESAPN